MGPLIFLSNYNMRAVITLLRLCDKYDVAVWIVADGEDDPIFLTRYASNVVAIRKPRDVGDFIDILRSLQKKFAENPAFVAPTSEYLNRYLLQNKEMLRQWNIHVPLPRQELYDSVSDKLMFHGLCKKFGLCVPDIFDVENIIFPCYAKPVSYYGYMGKPVLLNSKEELSKLHLSHPQANWFYQKQIEGESYYLLYYFSKKGNVIKFSQKNIAQQKGGRSILAACNADLHLTSISDEYEKMFRTIGYSGPVMVEIRKNEQGMFMIEANPRPWGPSQFTVDARIPIFGSFISDMGYDVCLDERVTDDECYYFWENGFDGSMDNADYFSVSQNAIAGNLEKWRKYDIFNRDDTRALYQNWKLL
ncbi:hypothetical protein FACS189475_07660 [Betaproteobacteria bacterium]|nr:hypothetical protein FACS189475_07660 [Betaproteobacteria bacterium]